MLLFSDEDFRVKFEGRVGEGIRGNIVFDDIVFIKSCLLFYYFIREELVFFFLIGMSLVVFVLCLYRVEGRRIGNGWL